MQHKFWETDFYEILELDYDCSLDDIEQAYHQNKKTPHGEKAHNTVEDAYRVLRDPEIREIYDTWYETDIRSNNDDEEDIKTATSDSEKDNTEDNNENDDSQSDNESEENDEDISQDNEQNSQHRLKKRPRVSGY